MKTEKIIILGGGFAGLTLAKKLSKSNFEITLIDRFNYHQFQPLFYQVATGRIEPSSISFPLRKIFQKKKNIHIRITEVDGVDTRNQLVYTSIGAFEYDRLVVATGCTTNFFGNEEIAKNAFPMKSTTEALALRNHILANFEDALAAQPGIFEDLMNIVVVGAGPTGVELSGALAELKSNILPKDYPDMDFSELRIFLLEGSDFVLGPMSDKSHKKGKEYLEKLGVDVWLNALVASYDGQVVHLKDGRSIPTRNLIWAAGVSGNVPGGFDASAIQRRGNRLIVDRYNRVKGLVNVFCLGDLAYMETDQYPKGHPQVANVAINQAKNLAGNLKSNAPTHFWKPFVYKDPGSMATVGKRRAVVDLPSFSFQGKLAWFTWMFLHLMLILSVKNKLIIFINWAISYFTNDTTLRLILSPTEKQIRQALRDNHPQEPAGV